MSKEKDIDYYVKSKGVDTEREKLIGQHIGYRYDVNLVPDMRRVTPFLEKYMKTMGWQDLNWLEDVHLLDEDGIPAVFDRYSNCFVKNHFPIPGGREDEVARKVLIAHLQSGNSYGIQLKEIHCKFPQPELGPWVEGSRTVGSDWAPPVLEGWERPAGH
jgi:hypothetical protein